MVDTSDLDGLDPYDLLASEAGRIDAYLSSLPTHRWAEPSRCDGWTVRDVTAHLAATEGYHHACLDGRVKHYVAAQAKLGVKGLADINARGITQRAARSNTEVIEEWRHASERTRAEMRSRDGGMMDTSVGDYPVRLQAFHIAAELAVHADDMYVPIPDDEAGARWAWRAKFSRFALREAKQAVGVEVGEGGTLVRLGFGEFQLDDAALTEAVAGRSSELHPVASEVLEALSVMP